jgi:hypothetical protein
MAYLSRSQKKAYATADSGADTNVLGREWLVIATDPVRKVNLVGFDAEHANKKSLSVVTADTIAKTEDGREIILRAYQSVSNPTTATTLSSVDAAWNPHAYFDDHGAMVIEPLENFYMASQSTTEQQPCCGNPKLSSWHHSETCSVFHPDGDCDECYHDAQQGTDKQFLGQPFHLDVHHQWRGYRDNPSVHFIRHHTVDEFLKTLSYSELLGFLPEDPADIPLERWHKRHRRIRRDRGGRIRLPAPVPVDYDNKDEEAPDSGEEQLLDTTEGNMETIGATDIAENETGAVGIPDRVQDDMDTDEVKDDQVLETDLEDTGQEQDLQLGEMDEPTIRRSNRRIKTPSRFSNAVMIGTYQQILLRHR